MQQSNAAGAAAIYDAGGGGEDAVMARWLQSAGLQHLASPVSTVGPDQRLLPNLLMQGYGPQNAEEKQKLHKFMRNLNFGGDSSSEPLMPSSHSFGGGVMDGFYSSEMRGEFGAGLLDLHSMDDTELLSEHAISEPFEPSPFMPPRGFENDFDVMPGGQQQGQVDGGINSSAGEKEVVVKESNVAKIKVVVRKRPLNKKEISRKEEDIVTVNDNSFLTVHEPKLKVDLTAYVDKHEFYFDAVLDEHVSNDEVYRVTVEPIIPTIFQRGKATCFAYGQTGSGKTYTMQPLPLRASEDIVSLMRHPFYRNQKLKLWLSYFEIYGGKLFDLLSDRRKLLMREDGRQQVCIVGLQEFEVSDVQIVKEYIEKGNAARSTGSTGANEESSRSHAILQLAIKKQVEVKDTRRQNDGNEPRSGKLVGKISFIDLAGSERGADTTDNDRQTRIEGAEINKSLLALKECIRALDNDQIHIPFRGSKLTEVLRDSFVGNSRTVMISCISPSAGSCEHTLNTLRYADRVKSLSKSSNLRKDQPVVPVPLGKELSSTLSYPFPTEHEVSYEQKQEAKATEISRKNLDTSYSSTSELDRQTTYMMPNYMSNGREESGFVPDAFDKEKSNVRSSYNGSSKVYSSSQTSFTNQDEEKVPRVSPPWRKASRDEKVEKQNAWIRKDSGNELSSITQKQQIYDTSSSRQYEQDAKHLDGDLDAILEEEEALVAAHRKEIENTMEIVREEMKLLEEVDQPGSLIDNYVTQLNLVLSRKVAGLVSLQARLARFQQRLKEQEILSRKRTSK